MSEASLDMAKLQKHGISDESELTPDKFQELHARGDCNAKRADGECSQTFELRHCYWCGKGNCVNPNWPVWFCYNGGHPNS